MSDVLRIALCGGTFDPFHRGHRDPILSVFDLMGWSRVVYVPAARQPFKLDQPHSSPYHRYAMTVLGTEDDDRLSVSLVELERPSISYTVDTLEHFRSAFPGAVLDWIIGDDNVVALPEWKSFERLFELANFVVLARVSDPPDLAPALAARVCSPERRGVAGSLVFAPNREVEVSSTEVRRRIREREETSTLLDSRVARYISAHGLYRMEESS